MFSNKKIELDVSKMTCHSGGAIGSDTEFRNQCIKYGIGINEYSYKTNYHTSKFKVELSDAEYEEGVLMVHKANKIMKRYNISSYMNLLARNWMQVKNSNVIYAIGSIIQPNSRNKDGYYNKSDIPQVDGGTGYAVQMGILKGIPIYVFNQYENKWYKFSYNTNRYITQEKVVLIENNNFCGIGTRNINENGINAINSLFIDTFKILNHPI